MRLSIFTFCILMVSSTIVKSQSLKETEDWIKQKFEEYEAIMKTDITSYSSNENSKKTIVIRVTCIPDFSNKGELWVNYNKYSSVTGKTKTTLYIIPLKYMKSVKYDFEDHCVYVLFSVKNEDLYSNKDNIRVLESDSKDFDTSFTQFGIEFDNKFEDDDMPNRFKKAFNHLIELNGGSVVKDVF